MEDVEAALFVPFCGRGSEFVVLQEFDVDDAEGLVAEIAGLVGEVAGEESGLSVLQFDGDGVFAQDFVGDFGIAERDVDVVVVVPVHQSLGVRRKFCGEDTDLGVGEGLVVVGLGGDFDWLLGLCCEECCQTESECKAGHCGDCSIGAGARSDRVIRAPGGRKQMPFGSAQGRLSRRSERRDQHLVSLRSTGGTNASVPT